MLSYVLVDCHFSTCAQLSFVVENYQAINEIEYFIRIKNI